MAHVTARGEDANLILVVKLNRRKHVYFIGAVDPRQIPQNGECPLVRRRRAVYSE